MRLKSILAVSIATFATFVAQAETRSIVGHCVATNADHIAARFNVNVSQVDNQVPAGTFEIGWKRGDANITLACNHPRAVLVNEHQGRFYGPAVATVKIGDNIRRWEGTIYVTVLDRRDANHQTERDVLRVRFIRDVWSNPEGDFFFEGLVTDGDIVVKKT